MNGRMLCAALTSVALAVTTGAAAQTDRRFSQPANSHHCAAGGWIGG